MKKKKIIRFKNKGIEPKCTQIYFPFIEHMNFNRPPEVEIIPPRPSEMTNAELEKWYIVSPSKKLRSEILARINKGVEFSKFRAVQYLGQEPQLVAVFRD